MPQRWRLATGLVIAATLLCASAARAAQIADTTVLIDNFAFSPAEVVVATGAKVTWTNHDDIPHTVADAGDPRTFKSPPLDTGEGFSFVFATAGTFHYFCSLHPHMQGTVVVR